MKRAREAFPSPAAALLVAISVALSIATAASAAAPLAAATPSTTTHGDNPGLSPRTRRRHGHNDASTPECLFLQYDRNPNLTSYEFQMQPHRGVVWDFEKAADALERLMRRLTQESAAAQPARSSSSSSRSRLLQRRWPTTPANVTLVEGSRWDTVLREHAFAVSTRRGQPLHPSRFPPHGRHLPWRRLAYLRLRSYILTLPPGTAPGGASPPGTADLSLKMKHVDPRLGPLQGLPPGFFAAGVRTLKLEADVHCDHQRVSISPLFAPVPSDLNVSRASAVAAYFPGLAQLARVDPDEQLPFCHAVWRRKATWAVVYRGLVGEVGLVAKYNTTLSDAAAGRRAKNGEVSLRIRREVAGIAGEGEKTERERLAALDEAMDALAVAAQRFRDEGWDGKTPGLDGRMGRKGRRGRKGGRPRWLGAARRADDEEEGGGEEEEEEEEDEGEVGRDVAALLRAAEAEGANMEDDNDGDDDETACERAAAAAATGEEEDDAASHLVAAAI
jgi:hypothetical protein